jgi:hypothetical protein
MFGYKSPKNIPGLTLWWDAADPTTINDGLVYQGQNVYKFVDKINNIVLSNFSGDNGPTYSYGAVNYKNAIHFPYHTDTNSSLKALVNSSITNINTSTKTIFFVFKPTTTLYGNNSKYAFSIWQGGGAIPEFGSVPSLAIRSGGGTNPYTEYLESSDGLTTEIFFRNEKSFQYGKKTSTNPDVNALQIQITKTGLTRLGRTKLPKFISLQENGFDSKCEFYKDDSLFYPYGQLSAGLPIPYGISIGSYYYGSWNKSTNQYPLEGYFCEMLYYNRFLDDSEVNTVSAYLLKKWDSLRATFSTANIPIYVAPPPPGPGPPPPPSYTAPTLTLDTTNIVRFSNSIENFSMNVVQGSQPIQYRGLVFDVVPNVPVFDSLSENPGYTGTPQSGTDNPFLTGIAFGTTYNVRGYVKDATDTYYTEMYEVGTLNIQIRRRAGNNTLSNPVDFRYIEETHRLSTYWDVRIVNLTPNQGYECGVICIVGGNTYPLGAVVDLGEDQGYSHILQTYTNADPTGVIANPQGLDYWNLDIALASETAPGYDGNNTISFRAYIIIDDVPNYSDIVIEGIPYINFLTNSFSGVNGNQFICETTAPETIIEPDLVPQEVGFYTNTDYKDPYYETINTIGYQGYFENTLIPKFVSTDFGQPPTNLLVKAYVVLFNGLKIWSSPVTLGETPPPSGQPNITLTPNLFNFIVEPNLSIRLYGEVTPAGQNFVYNSQWANNTSFTNYSETADSSLVVTSQTTYQVNVLLPQGQSISESQPHYLRLRMRHGVSLGEVKYSSTFLVLVRSFSLITAEIDPVTQKLKITYYIPNTGVNVQNLEFVYSSTDIFSNIPTDGNFDPVTQTIPAPTVQSLGTPVYGTNELVTTLLTATPNYFVRLRLKTLSSPVSETDTYYQYSKVVQINYTPGSAVLSNFNFRSFQSSDPLLPPVAYSSNFAGTDTGDNCLLELGFDVLNVQNGGIQSMGIWRDTDPNFTNPRINRNYDFNAQSNTLQQPTNGSVQGSYGPLVSPQSVTPEIWYYKAFMSTEANPTSTVASYNISVKSSNTIQFVFERVYMLNSLAWINWDASTSRFIVFGGWAFSSGLNRSYGFGWVFGNGLNVQQRSDANIITVGTSNTFDGVFSATIDPGSQIPVGGYISVRPWVEGNNGIKIWSTDTRSSQRTSL